MSNKKLFIKHLANYVEMKDISLDYIYKLNELQ